MDKRYAILIAVAALLLLALAVANLFVGAVSIPASGVVDILMGNEPEKMTWKVIVLESRLPMTVTAMLSGAALAVAGLLLQTAFNNPLAGPSILGVSSGASLGVAIVMLSIGTSFGSMFGVTTMGYAAVLGGAMVGSMAVLMILLGFSSFVKSNTVLLIIGILVGYLTSSAISLLNFFSTQEGVHSYMIWGLGSFSGVTNEQLPMFGGVVAVGLIWSMLLVKPLNALLLGENYASNLGVNVKSVRNQLLVLTGLLTAVVTAYCGPIGFVGLVVPHISRLLLATSNHARLLPMTMLSGAIVALFCTLLSVLPSNGVLPINALTPIIGVPIILYIIINRRKIPYFN